MGYRLGAIIYVYMRLQKGNALNSSKEMVPLLSVSASASNSSTARGKGGVWVWEGCGCERGVGVGGVWV